MKNFLNYITTTFGFTDIIDFGKSMVHIKLFLFTVPVSISLALITVIFGVTPMVFAAFIILAILELITGILGAKAKKQLLTSKKFSRFGLKIFVWLSLIFVANAFSVSYEDIKGVQGFLLFHLFSWLHTTLIAYIAFEYLISVVENLGKITGKTNNRLLKLINKKFDQFLGVTDDSTDFKEKD